MDKGKGSKISDSLAEQLEIKSCENDAEGDEGSKRMRYFHMKGVYI